MVTLMEANWRAGEVRYAGGYQLVMENGRDKGFVCEVQAPVIGNEFDETLRKSRVSLIAASPRLLRLADKMANATAGDFDACKKEATRILAMLRFQE